MEEIDLKEIIEVFWKKKTTIILLIAIFAVLGFIYSSFILVPKYSASTTLLLAQSTNDGSSTGITTTDITLNSKLISTYSKLVKSTAVIREVIGNLGIDDTEESVRKNVSVVAESGTEIIKITATNLEPKKAALIANEMAKVFGEKVKEYYSINNIHVVDIAEEPKGPTNINHAKDIAIFAAIGLVIGAGYIFISYMLDNSIKSQEDVEKNIQVPVLASIPVYENELEKTRAKGKSKGGKRR